jgi:hypothetical protein
MTQNVALIHIRSLIEDINTKGREKDEEQTVNLRKSYVEKHPM